MFSYLAELSAVHLFPSTFPFSSLNSWVHPPFPRPPLLPPPHRLRSLQRICMSAPEQYEKRWNRTPSGCLCSASLIWQKELQFGPQTQSENKCRLLKGAIRTHIRKQTHRYSPRKNLHCTVFSLNISACRSWTGKKLNKSTLRLLKLGRKSCVIVQPVSIPTERSHI